ncbi:MAG: MBOAT family protein [Clostridiales bacterium]|jgi:alginate O-acetyltransferase complex protein AlgI|nr:MBOAT family protein [Clostridiales bacterium]
MVFSSIAFLFVFLPVVLSVYYLVGRKAKNAVLLVASLLFYFYGEPRYTVLLVISSLSDYLHALYIENRRGTKRAKYALVSSIVVNLLLLGVFKYADFLIGAVNGALQTSIPLPHLRLPIGISFFTFQTMSYTIDVYRNKAHAQKNLLSMATYVCLFPQLVAGPIVRYVTVADELDNRAHTLDGFAKGVRRFILGLGKKVLLANSLGALSGELLNGVGSSVMGLWAGTLAFMLQVYFDFSGYSDMAIGLGRLFGFGFPENFDYPFISKSISEFWRRWHMTLGSWFRDYVYIPLGGNRVKPPRWVFNLLVVWALTGLWHGAAWNFVMWGLYLAVVISLEKLLMGRVVEKWPAILRRVYAMLFITLSFVIFNADAGIGWKNVLTGMFGTGGLPVVSAPTAYYLKSYALVCVLGVIGATPLIKKAAVTLRVRQPILAAVLEPVLCCALMVLVVAYLVDGSFNPFLYFRF